METLLFYLFAAAALAGAINVVAQKRVFYSAISLIFCLGSLSGIYVLLQAPFIAAVQVIVYAGAIMVLFLFVIMLLDPFSADVLPDKNKYLAFIGIFLGSVALITLYPLLRAYDSSLAPANADLPGGATGGLTHFGEVLFRDYLLPFEATSVLILIAIIGAVVLAKRDS